MREKKAADLTEILSHANDRNAWSVYASQSLREVAHHVLDSGGGAVSNVSHLQCTAFQD